MFSVLVACLGLLTFEGFALRLSPEGDVSSASPQKHKVAVMVSGTFARYIVQSSMDRLVAPMVAQGHTVDLFLGLNKGYHWSGSTMEHDPFFAGLDRSSPANFSSGIKDKVTQAVEKAGGHLRSCLLLDNVTVINKPVFKNYGGSSWLKLHKVLDQLWDEVEAEEAASGSKYTHVMIMRDDAYWYADFNLNKLLKTHGNGVAKDKSWVMAQGCGAGSSYNAKKHEVNDFAFFLSRPAARSFGKIYTAVTAETCRDSVASMNCPHEWKRSEAFFPDYATKSKISLVKVDVSDIPYQRAWLKQSSNPQEPSVCVRYVCAPSHVPLSVAQLDDSYDAELDEEGKPKGCLDATKAPSKGHNKHKR